MLGRHVDLSDNKECQDKENFLREQLNIPSQWIYEAKATLASVCNRLVNKSPSFSYGILQ
jgi:Nuclear protein 96.